MYLRGYDLNRFAGDSAVALNTEVHVELGRSTAFLPLKYGVFGLYDVGRVYLDNDPTLASGSSSKWHQGYGGGVWLGLFANSVFFNLAGSLKAAMVHSDEGNSFYIASGFGL
jgi:hemolysin activation/secretion protein